MIVGVNEFVDEAESLVEILKVGDEAERTSASGWRSCAPRGTSALVESAPGGARRAAAEDRNIIPAMLDCARAYCTLFEIRHVLEEIYGSYREPVFF